MFVQIGNRAFNPQHITKIIFHSKCQVTVRLTGDSEIGFGAIEGAEFLAWYDTVGVIVASELMKADATDTRPSGHTADPLVHYRNRVDECHDLIICDDCFDEAAVQ